MTAADVERLYRAIEALRDDVHGYRADLNGRLRALETAEAERAGSERTRGSLGRVALGVGALAAAVATVLNVILTRV